MTDSRYACPDCGGIARVPGKRCRECSKKHRKIIQNKWQSKYRKTHKEKLKRKRRSVWQKHHMHYPGEEAGERAVLIRKGVHAAIRFIRNFRKLTKNEVEAIQYECMRKLEVDDDV